MSLSLRTKKVNLQIAAQSTSMVQLSLNQTTTSLTSSRSGMQMAVEVTSEANYLQLNPTTTANATRRTPVTSRNLVNKFTPTSPTNLWAPISFARMTSRFPLMHHRANPTRFIGYGTGQLWQVLIRLYPRERRRSTPPAWMLTSQPIPSLEALMK